MLFHPLLPPHCGWADALGRTCTYLYSAKLIQRSSQVRLIILVRHSASRHAAWLGGICQYSDSASLNSAAWLRLPRPGHNKKDLPKRPVVVERVEFAWRDAGRKRR